MTESMVEFKWLDVKPVGNDTVIFRLENGTTVKVRVSLDRAGLALNMRNPDGSEVYNFNANMQVAIVPAEKKFSVPRSQIQMPVAQAKPPDPRHVS
jgi:hypothetical protein